MADLRTGTGLSQPPFGNYTRETCPNRAKHTGSPMGYTEWQEWATEMAKTHDQHRCPKCGYWSIWERKKAST